MSPRTLTSAKRKTDILAYLEGVPFATVRQVYEGLPIAHRLMTMNTTYTDLKALAKNGTVKVKKKKGFFHVYYVHTKEEPTDALLPRVDTHKAIQGVYSRSSKYQDYYYNSRY